MGVFACLFVRALFIHSLSASVCLSLDSLLFMSAVICLPQDGVISHNGRVIIQMFAYAVSVLLDIFIHS